MKKELKEVKLAADGEIKKRKPHLDSEGRTVITLNASDDSAFLSPYSENDTPVISTDVAEFIRARADATSPLYPITVRIKSSCIDESEKALYRLAINEYFTEKYIACEREHKKNRFAVGMLTALGIIVLAIAIAISSLPFGQVWSEVVNIVAWVLVWEAVDIGVFHSRGLRHEKLLLLRLISAKIEYEDLK
jgi:hypothetical protein